MTHRLHKLAVNEEGFIFDPERGNSFTTNAAGLFILRLLVKGAKQEEVIEALMERYGIPPGDAERDLADFLDQLKGESLWDGEDE